MGQLMADVLRVRTLGQEALTRLLSSAKSAASTVLARCHMLQRLTCCGPALNVEDLFKKAAGGKEEMSEEQFGKFVSSLPDHGLSKEQVKLIYKEFGPHGLKKVGFARIVEEYCSCVQSITVTDA